MKKVLIIDDDEQIGKAFEEFLAPVYKVEREVSAEAGLKAATEKAPDLILLDIMMPHTTGQEVLEKLKADPATKDIPVVIESSLYTPEMEFDTKKSGAAGYLTKSEVTPKVLLDTVASLI